MISVPSAAIYYVIDQLSAAVDRHDFELQPDGPEVMPAEHARLVWNALALPPSTLLAERPEMHAAGLSLVAEVPEPLRLSLACLGFGASFRHFYPRVPAKLLIECYACALLADPTDPLVSGAIGFLGQMLAPPVVDIGDVDPTPDVAPAVLTQTGDVVGGPVPDVQE